VAKKVVMSRSAASDLRRHANVAPAVMEKLSRYAETGAGDVKRLVGAGGAKRLRVGDFRVIFEETNEAIVVTKIAPKGSAYD